DVAAGADPFLAQARQAAIEIDRDLGIAVGTRRVVDPHRRLARAFGEVDLAHGDADLRMEIARHIDLARGRQRTGRDMKRFKGGVWHRSLRRAKSAWLAIRVLLVENGAASTPPVPVPTPARPGSGSKGLRAPAL